MSHYLVTGGAGFIGSHLVETLLGAGHEVSVLDDFSTGRRSNVPAAVKLQEGSVTDAALLRDLLLASANAIDGCFHLAAISSVERCRQDWAASHAVNVGGAVNVFAAAKANHRRGPIPVVYASSAAIYGDNNNLPLSETEVPRPLSAYGFDKLTTEGNARIAAAVHGVPAVGLRFFNIYGPRQDPASPYSGVISIFARRIKSGDGISLFGDGEQSRDFVYVGDAVQALLHAMLKPAPAAVFNIATGRGTSLLTLIDALGQLTRQKPAISFAPARAGDIRHSRGDAAAFAAAYNFTCRTPLHAGLAETITAL